MIRNGSTRLELVWRRHTILVSFIAVILSCSTVTTAQHAQQPDDQERWLPHHDINGNNRTRQAQWIWKAQADSRLGSLNSSGAPHTATRQDQHQQQLRQPDRQPNTWMQFQKTINVSMPFPCLASNHNNAALELKAKIAVDSKYWLWTHWKDEGNTPPPTLLVREGGLKRGPTPQDTWYDRVVVSMPLSPIHKVNSASDTSQTQLLLTLEVWVWYWGKHGFSHKDSGQGGFLFEGKILHRPTVTREGAAVVVASVMSDSSWQVRRHPNFVQSTNQSSAGNQYYDDNVDVPNYRLPEYNIMYDTRQQSSSWESALELGPPGSPPWNQLWPRRIPQWKDSPHLQEYTHVRYFHEGVDDESHKTSATATHPQQRRQQASSPALVIQARLPYNTQFTPYVEIPESLLSTINGSSLRVDISTDNYQYHPGTGKSSVRYLRSTYIASSNSSDISQVGGSNHHAFESPGWLNGHVVTYRISLMDNANTSKTNISTSGKLQRQALQLLLQQLKQNSSTNTSSRIQVRYRETSYDTALTGSFHCNDDFYNTLWIKARRTLLVNMRDNFMDCPDRERAQWWGDLTVDIGQVMYALDHKSHVLIQKAILDLVQWQRQTPSSSLSPSATTFKTTNPNTAASCQKLHAPVPAGNHDKELPLQMLASIGWYGFYSYYLYTGDVQTIQAAYPQTRTYLMTCWTINATTGLVNHRHGDWDWEDWGENYDSRILDNAWYVLALKAAIPMANLTTGYTDDMEFWNHQLASIEQNFDHEFWTGNSYQSLEQREAKKPPDDRSNAMAVLAGMVPATEKQDRHAKIVTVLQKQFWASPYMEKYVLESLFQMGYPDEALRRMKHRYYDMVTTSNITTLWEQFDLHSGTYNHAWSGGPLTLLSQYVAGVAPTAPGYRTFQVLPREGRMLADIHVSVPVFLDNQQQVIAVTIQKLRMKDADKYVYRLELSSPASAEAVVGIPKVLLLPTKTCRLNSITINHTTAWTYGGGDQQHQYRPQGWSFHGDTGGYIQWRTSPGPWHFEGLCNCKVLQPDFILGLIR